jgi:hypothetical protein
MVEMNTSAKTHTCCSTTRPVHYKISQTPNPTPNPNAPVPRRNPRPNSPLHTSPRLRPRTLLLLIPRRPQRLDSLHNIIIRPLVLRIHFARILLLERRQIRVQHILNPLLGIREVLIHVRVPVRLEPLDLPRGDSSLERRVGVDFTQNRADALLLRAERLRDPRVAVVSARAEQPAQFHGQHAVLGCVAFEVVSEFAVRVDV